ncbi:MAG: hypothetical protein ABR950_07865 [Candidatus Dormibacteria bacterium]
MDHDWTEPGPAVARRPRAGWDLGEILGWGLIVAITLLAAAYVAAGIMEAGASAGPNQLEATLLYATEWVSPYVALFPLAALGIAWWAVRRHASSGAPMAPAADDDAPDAESAAEAGLAHLFRARALIILVGAALIVIICAAIGALVSSILLMIQGELGGNPVWASEAETLGVVTSALLLCGIGLGGAIRLWLQTSHLLADDEPVWEPEPVAAPVPE